MARNPLDDGPCAETATQNRAMQIGETKVIISRDAKTGDVIKTSTLHRTARPYAYDLADAYNASMTLDAKERGLLWTVDSNGEVRLGIAEGFTSELTHRLKRASEWDRQQFRHRMEYPVNREAAE